MPTHANLNIIQQWATKHIGLKSAATVKRKATRDPHLRSLAKRVIVQLLNLWVCLHHPGNLVNQSPAQPGQAKLFWLYISLVSLGVGLLLNNHPGPSSSLFLVILIQNCELKKCFMKKNRFLKETWALQPDT